MDRERAKLNWVGLMVEMSCGDDDAEPMMATLGADLFFFPPTDESDGITIEKVGVDDTIYICE